MNQRISSTRSSASSMSLGIKFEAYEVEFVSSQLETKLPYLFASQHHNEVPIKVVLFDALGNQFEVTIVKKDGDVFFGQGWRDMGRFYGIHLGGWIKIVYVRIDRFYIEARDRFGNPPIILGQPKILRLGQEPEFLESTDVAANVLDQSMYVGKKPILVFTLYTRVAAVDISTAYLHVPAEYFQTCYSKVDTDVVFVDEFGKAWPCHLIFPKISSVTEVRVRGWFNICHANGYTEGMEIKLEAPLDDSKFIFLGRR